ncbi:MULTISPECIES: hypothetical protein [unclassified Rhizobium]|uniref:hypothetical protein n=1 Tax=unclassified Rhizobium TaxID=2613769 RepID=UPI0007F150F5|nr:MULTISPECIES: hypothetical protein [unclassified Rhizobium]ANK84779.1 hypothetical protein AMK02_CH01147 [Rhizobium sp. N731]ANL15027.1 hypothetical protein AMJ97_CH01147 [Rhizobium sp. N1314]
MRGFLFGGDTGKTQNEISGERKRLAYAMLQQGMETSPVQSPWQGAARLVQALMGGLALRQEDKEQRAGAAEAPPPIISSDEAFDRDDKLNPADATPVASGQAKAVTPPVAASVVPRQRATPVAIAGTTPSRMRKTPNGTLWSIEQ